MSAQLPSLSSGSGVCFLLLFHCGDIRAALRLPRPGPGAWRVHLPTAQCLCRGWWGRHAEAGCHLRRRLEGAPALLSADDFISWTCGSHGRFHEQGSDTVPQVKAPVEEEEVLTAARRVERSLSGRQGLAGLSLQNLTPVTALWDTRTVSISILQMRKLRHQVP